jgi:hypothetical protein
MTCTQIKKYGPVLVGKHRTSLEDEGSLSAGFFAMISGRDTASMIQRFPVFSWRIR